VFHHFHRGRCIPNLYQHHGNCSGSVSYSVPTSNGGSLHCTLFLFDDKLVIVKRPKNDKGRVLSGIDNVDKVTKGAIPDKKRTGMSCKGVVDLTDVVITDVSGAGE
jgi:protein ECT2